MTVGKQPGYFFTRFLNDIQPSIAAFAPFPDASWSIPCSALLGMKRGTLFKWRTWPRLPDDAYQNTCNILALQSIAFLDDDATLEEAQAIARGRLTEALSGMKPPKPDATRKPPRPRAPSKAPRARRTTDDDAWAAATLYAKGLHPEDIAVETGFSLRTVQKLLKNVLGDRPRRHRRQAERQAA